MDDAAAPQHTPDDAFGPELADDVRRLAKASVLVVGDAMLDRYLYGQVSRISPEAPVPVLAVQRELALAGGAGNVVRNLTALGAAVAFVSVVGDDQPGSDLTGLIGGQPNVEPWLLVQGARCTTVKTRFIARGQQLLRADHEETGPIHPKMVERMLRIVGDALAATSVTALSDYGKGVLAGEVPANIMEAARRGGRPVVIDPFGVDLSRYEGADLVVITAGELSAASEDAAGIAAAAGRLRERHQFGGVLVNRELHGLTLVQAGLEALHVPSLASELFDNAGAQDSVVATMAAAMAAGLDRSVGARLAALAAGIVIGQPGLAVATVDDMLGALTPQGRALRKIVSREVAAEQVERWRRLGWRTGFAAGVLDPQSAHDRRRLERARAACDRLVVGLSAEDFEPATPLAETPHAETLAMLAGLSSVDLVCLYDESGPEQTLQMLRPELLVESGKAASVRELVTSWGGEVLEV